MNLLNNLLDYRNIHLAYERTKNHLLNKELHSFQEQKAFESCIPAIYDDIRNTLKSPNTFVFQNIEILHKPKDWSIKSGWAMRPLARISFYDAVIIQCVMNIVGESIASILPSRNFGYRLTDRESIYMYEHWKWGYSKFVDAEIQAIQGNNSYEYVLELDIEEFYPSIDHSILLKELEPYLMGNSHKDSLDKKADIILTWIKKILRIPQADALGNTIAYSGFGLPQGLLSSPILAMFYIRNCFKELEPLLEITEYFAYVDDFRFYCETKKQALEIKEKLTVFLHSLNLKINENKTYILPIGEAKIKEADVMGRASNIGRAMLNEVILSAKGKEIIKANLRSLVNEIQELYKKLQETGELHSELDIKIEKFALYRTIKLVETEKEWAKYASDLKYIPMLKSNFIAMIHVIYNFATTVRQKQKFLKILEEIILDEKYTELTYIKYVALQYFFMWSPYETKLTESRINRITKRIISKEAMSETFIKAILSQCHEDWYEIILDKICEMGISRKIATDRELATMLYLAILKSDHRILELDCPKKYSQRVVAKLEQSCSKLIYRVSYNTSIEKGYEKYLNDEQFKNMEYIKFKLKTKDPDGKTISMVSLPPNKVSLKEYSSEINDDSKLYILRQVFEWLSVQLNYKDLFNTKIPCSVVNPEYIWFDQNIGANRGNIILLGNPFLNNEIYYEKVPDRIWKKEFIGLFELCYNIDIRNTKMKMLSEGIPFWAFRIIQLLRARSFRLEEFVAMCLEILRNLDLSDRLTVNSEHFRLSHLMNHYIPDPYLHDKFIEVSQFVESSWQNGSKECYFFTLHNHEHARFLIFVIHDLIEKTGFRICLNQREAFRLFTACFLHDIGMLSEPPERMLFIEKFPSDKINIIFNEMLQPLLEVASTTKEITIEDNCANRKRFFIAAELVDQLRTDIVRKEHHKISANEILWDYPDLPLTVAERRDIAELSNAHGMKIGDVNDLPEKLYDGRSPVNLRLLAHLLRLADLCDVSHTRVSKDVLERNENRMGKVSLFHWIKHMSVEGIEIACDDEDVSKAKIKIHHSYLPRLYAIEDDLKVACRKDCKRNYEFKYEWGEEAIRLVDYDLNEEGSCIQYLNKDVCNLLCAFINQAYNWFYLQVVTVNRYFEELNIDIKLDLSIVINEDERKMDFLFVENRNFQRSAQEFMVDYLLHY